MDIQATIQQVMENIPLPKNPTSEIQKKRIELQLHLVKFQEKYEEFQNSPEFSIKDDQPKINIQIAEGNNIKLVNNGSI